MTEGLKLWKIEPSQGAKFMITEDNGTPEGRLVATSVSKTEAEMIVKMINKKLIQEHLAANGLKYT